MDDLKKKRAALLKQWIASKGGATSCLLAAGLSKDTPEWRSQASWLSTAQKIGFGETAAVAFEEFFESQGMQPGYLLTPGALVDEQAASKPRFSSDRSGGKPHAVTNSTQVTNVVRAPVVEWARLGVDLTKANSEWPDHELQKVETDQQVAPISKFVLVQDDDLDDVRRGDKVLIEPCAPEHRPPRNKITLFQLSDGGHILRRFVPLPGDGFEAADDSGRVLDGHRHGLQVVGTAVYANRSL